MAFCYQGFKHRLKSKRKAPFTQYKFKIWYEIVELLLSGSQGQRTPEREREGERERERQTDRQTDRQRQRQREIVGRDQEETVYVPMLLYISTTHTG